MKEQIQFKLIELEIFLKNIEKDLIDKENLTIGQISRMTVDREKVKFAIEILKETLTF